MDEKGAMCAALVTTPFFIPRPEIATIPAGSFYMREGELEISLPEFQIGKYEVTNEEFDRYIDLYGKTSYILLGRKGPFRNLLLAWGKEDQKIEINAVDPTFLRTGQRLAEGILTAASSLPVPPILQPEIASIDGGAYAAYAMFSDWAGAKGYDPFSLLIGILSEKERIWGRFEVQRAVPDQNERNVGSSPAMTRARRPAVNVNWYEAYGFSRAVGMRLPTQQEWVKAGRGPEGYKYGTANGILNREEAHYDAEMAAHVGSYPPNGYGLYDMTGNVDEWTMDETEDGLWKGLRGGSFRNYRMEFFRLDCGSCRTVDYRDDNIGFRVAASVPLP